MPPKKKKKKKLEELRVALTLSSHWMASSLKSKEGSLRSSALSVPYTRRNVAAAVSAAGPLAPAPAAAIDPRPPLRRADPRPRAAGRAEERRRTEEQRAAQPSRWRRRDGAGGFRCVASGVRAWRARARPNRSRAVGVVTYTSCRVASRNLLRFLRFVTPCARQRAVRACVGGLERATPAAALSWGRRRRRWRRRRSRRLAIRRRRGLSPPERTDYTCLSRPRREKSPASPPLLSLRGIQRRWRTARISDFRTIPALHYHQSYGVSACVCFNLQMKMGSRFSQRPWIWWVITIDQQDEIVCSGVWLRQFNSEFQSSDYSSNSDSYTKVVPL